MLPGAVTSAYRTYADIRKWQLEGNVLRPEEWNIEPFSNPKQLESFSDLIPDQETHELPEYVKGMGYVLCFIIFAGLAVLLLRMFWRFCGEFRDTEEENGDVSDTFLPDRREKLRPAARQRGADSERERIRRRYRREIKKHHPGKPLPSLTPHEIEAEAGLAGTPEGEELHGIYEEARYDRC